MTTRNFHALFEPRAIALIGASNTPGSVGEVLARNLLESGFSGPVLPVNPHAKAVRSALAYASVADLPVTPDLAVIATPAPTVPGIVAELGRRGCRAAVVISAGFSDGGLRQDLLDAARPHLLRVVGPNCLGFISPARGINASFSQLTPRPGDIALVAQSGAIATAALDWAHARGFGFSHVVTLGDMADVDFGDVLDYLALDRATKAIVLYVESIYDARKFMTAGRIAARAKPVVVIKSGRSAAGAKAAFSHTGALAGSDAVYDAAIRRAGMLRVTELRELFDAVNTLGAGAWVRGERLAILTNGGGAGVMAVDALAGHGGRLADLAPETLEALDAVLPATWSHANPVDIIGDAPPERYAAALEAVLADRGAEALLILNCPTAVADSLEAAQAVVRVLENRPKGRVRRPILTCWLGETSAAPARKLLIERGFPSHETPDEAVRAFMHMVDHHRNQELLLQTPPASPQAADRKAARRIIDAVLVEERDTLTALEAEALLAAYGVPVVRNAVAATPKEAAALAATMEGPFALKIRSADISHKSDVGGVVLGLADPAAVETAAEAMLERVGQALPQARLEGFLIQPMAERPHARELIAGLAVDPTFGPVVLFGAGGIAVEVAADRSVGLPPLNRVLAREMISRTRVSRMLRAFRDRGAVDEDTVAEVLERLSMMAIEIPEIAELDINPLLADENGVLALDARVRLAAPSARFAIRPYPAGLESELTLESGERLVIRPIRPQDAPLLEHLVANTSAEDVRLRFHGGLRTLPNALAARLSQIDYDRELAMVAVDQEGAIVGVSRLIADPEGEAAEFALLVRTDHQKQGLGRALLGNIVDYARSRGLRRVWGDVMSDNERMLSLTDALGFRRELSEDFRLVRVAVPLEREMAAS
ncbi:MAG: GNAT family N-acetyltransferase [Phenylobacterium sp.]|uniref:bifunctional acetate--CoA ligase family protein/GNAT family N-acetyltransferase n=1 Tax=Phenylobacterium sp. TaxID=1871053 RepID=UPI00391ACFEC